MVVGKGKAFYMQTRIPNPIFITDPILISSPIYFPSPILILTFSIISAPTNTLTLHYGLIQPGSRVTTASTDSMVITTKSVVFFRL